MYFAGLLLEGVSVESAVVNNWLANDKYQEIEKARASMAKKILHTRKVVTLILTRILLLILIQILIRMVVTNTHTPTRTHDRYNSNNNDSNNNNNDNK